MDPSFFFAVIPVEFRRLSSIRLRLRTHPYAPSPDLAKPPNFSGLTAKKRGDADRTMPKRDLLKLILQCRIYIDIRRVPYDTHIARFEINHYDSRNVAEANF